MTGSRQKQTQSELEHGGRLDDAAARYGGDPSAWIDLSTGLNPWPWPVPDLAPEVWQRLPDAGASDHAIEAARTYYRAPAEAFIVAANGSQALIQAMPRAFDPCSVAVVGFTYREHTRCWALAGHDVASVDGIADIGTDARVVVLTNPNNPDGTVTPRETLLALADELDRRSGLLVVDEAFCDVVPEASVADCAGRSSLCVLRSFGKFFGLGGVRAGFALGDATLGAALESIVGPWATSGPALEIAARALSDSSWQQDARRRLADARQRLERTLQNEGLDIVGGTDLFVLAACGDAADLHERLCTGRILTRRFPEKPDWLRFGLPPDDAASERLARVLREARSAVAAE